MISCAAGVTWSVGITRHMISCAGVTGSVGITHHDQLCWGDRECGYYTS